MISIFILLAIVVLVLLSGLFSGLTLGLLGLKKSDLERKIRLGDENARKVYAIRKRGNLLLCTLLLGNVAVNSTIAILLGNVAAGVVAGVVATGLIVIFGEILPQAVISRYAMAFGARSAWLVKIFIVIFYPVCFPIAWTLDKILGEKLPSVWSKRELKDLITYHRKVKASGLDRDEERIIHGALSFSDKTVKDIMISKTHAFVLKVGDVIDKKMVLKMKKFGFSRFPVYKNKIDNVVGVLFFRDLVGLSLGKKVGKICDRKVLRVLDTRKLDSLLGLFIRERNHMAVVFDVAGEFVGVISLEDVVEEIVGKEIVDEDDFFEDVEKERRA